MSNQRPSTRLRRLLLVCGLALLAGLAAGSAQAQSVRSRERQVERAKEAVGKAGTAVNDAEHAAEAAAKAVAAEKRRLAKEAERDPTAHGPMKKLSDLEKAQEEAQAAVEKAKEDLRDARKKLEKELDRLIKEIGKDLGKKGLSPEKKGELLKKLEEALRDKLDAVDDSADSAAAKKDELDDIEDAIEDSDLSDDDKADLLRKLRRIRRDVFQGQIDAIEESDADADDKREGLDELRKEIEDSDLDEETRNRLLAKLQELLGSLNEGEDEGSALPGRAAEEWSVAGVTAPAGSRLILTGTVVAGEEATLTAVGPDGAVLTGVVVEVAGERRVTDGQGRVLFRVAATATGMLAVALPGLGDDSAAAARVLPALADGAAAAAPEIATAPRFATPGSTLRLGGSGFRGDAAGDAVALGDSALPVLAASPTEIVAATPADLAPGETSLTVETATGRAAAVPVIGVHIGLRGGPAHLRRGETARVQVVVEGTRESVPLVVTNASPQIVRLEGGPATTIATRGGRDNAAEIVLTGVTPGAFRLAAEVADETAAEAPDAEELRRLEEKASEASGRGHDLEADGKLEEAADAYAEAAEGYEKAGRKAQAATEHTNAGQALSEAAEAAAEAGDAAKADELHERAAEEYEKAGREAQAAAERAQISGR